MRPLLRSVLLTVCIALALAVNEYDDPNDTTTLLSQLNPAAMNLTLVFNVTSNPNSASLKTCANATLNAPCLPVVSNTDKDSIKVSWFPNAHYNLTWPASVTLKWCYSTPSTAMRAWRKGNNLIYKDKQCGDTLGPSSNHSALAQNLPLNGTYVWKIPTGQALATYFIRAYVACNETVGRRWCAYGNSTGYFQVKPIDPRTPALEAWTIGLSFVGPTLLALAYGTEQFLAYRKHRK